MSHKPFNCKWEHFYHQADIGVRGYGRSACEAFEQGALAMMAVICNPEKVEPVTSVEISCNAPDAELLFCDFLNAIVYEIATNCMLFSRFEVAIAGKTLTATAWGETVDNEKHKTAVEVKAATYTQLAVTKDAKGNWLAQCVVDV